MSKKISDFLKGSEIGKSLDNKTLALIDKVFEKAVAKGVALQLAESVKAENAKFKTELYGTMDAYIDQVIEERLKENVIDKAKVKMAEKITKAFNDVFGEMFMTEGNSKLAQLLKDKTEEIDKIKENYEANVKALKESFNKKLEEANKKIKTEGLKFNAADKKAKLAEAAKIIEANTELTLVGKGKAKKLIEEKIEKGEKFDTKAIVEGVIKISGKANDTPFHGRKPAPAKQPERGGKKEPLKENFGMANYTAQLGNG